MKQTTVEQRLERIQGISLLEGSHPSPTKKGDLQMCVMEAVAFGRGCCLGCCRGCCRGEVEAHG